MPQKTSRRLVSRRAFLGVSAVVFTGAAAGWAVWTRPSFEGQAMSVVDAHQAAVSGAVFLIDIRRPDEWTRTGLGEGARPLDMRRRDFVEALDDIVGGNRRAPVALICARGVRSARLSNRLAEAGFLNIIDVPEGMLGSHAGPGWLQTGLPVVAFKG